MSTNHVAAAFATTGLSSEEKLLLLIYGNHANADGRCAVPDRRLVTETGMAINAIDACTDELQNRGFLEIEDPDQPVTTIWLKFP